MASNWTLRNTTVDNSWFSVTYGNPGGIGLFVAVANGGGTTNRVMTSQDGIAWTIRTGIPTNQWYNVTYGNGRFVAVSNAGTTNSVMTSTNGISWAVSTVTNTNGWTSVTYGNGLFVAVAFTGTNRVMTSPDGLTWTLQTPSVDNQWYSVTYGNGLFVAVGISGTGNRVMTSPNGINWTSQVSAGDFSWVSVTYGTPGGTGLFVAVANGGTTTNRSMFSTNGINWTLGTTNDYNWNSVTYGGDGRFVAVSYSGVGNRVMTSFNGSTWESMVTPADNSWVGITFGSGLFVAVSISGTNNRVMTASDVSCYYVGSKILCLINDEEIYIPIEEIKKGVLVKTYKHGFKKVELIGKREQITSPNDIKIHNLYKLKDKSLTVSGGHYILVDELPENLTHDFYKSSCMIEDKKILLACDCDLFEQVNEIRHCELYHIVLESETSTTNYGIYADGILSESTSKTNFILHNFTNTG